MRQALARLIKGVASRKSPGGCDFSLRGPVLFPDLPKAPPEKPKTAGTRARAAINGALQKIREARKTAEWAAEQAEWARCPLCTLRASLTGRLLDNIWRPWPETHSANCEYFDL